MLVSFFFLSPLTLHLIFLGLSLVYNACFFQMYSTEFHHASKHSYSFQLLYPYMLVKPAELNFLLIYFIHTHRCPLVYRFQPSSNLSFLHSFLGKPGFIFSALCTGFCVLNSLISFLIPLVSDITDWLLFCLLYFTDFRPWCWERPFLILHGKGSVVSLALLIHSSVHEKLGHIHIMAVINRKCCCGVIISSGIKFKNVISCD